MFSGLGLTSSSTATVISRFESLRSKFAVRVIHNGGTVESSACLATDLRDIDATYSSDQALLNAFASRVTLDGGSVREPQAAFDAIDDLT